MVQNFFALLETLKIRDEEGQGLVEYALILALIAVVCVAALTALGGGVSGMMTSLSGSI